MRRRLRRRSPRLPAGLQWCDRSAAVCDARLRARRLRDEQRVRALTAGYRW